MNDKNGTAILEQLKAIRADLKNFRQETREDFRDIEMRLVLIERLILIEMNLPSA